MTPEQLLEKYRELTSGGDACLDNCPIVEMEDRSCQNGVRCHEAIEAHWAKEQAAKEWQK